MTKRLKPFFPLAVFFLTTVPAILWGQALPTPSGFSGTPGNGSVELNWAPQSSATAYQIYREVVDSPTPTPTGTWAPATPTPLATVVAAATPIFQDGQATNGRIYRYLLMGMNSAGEGAAATVIAAPFSPPLAVQSVQVENTHSNALDLSWGIPLSTYPVTQYQVFRYSAPAASFTSTPSPVPGSVLLTAVPTPYAVTTTNQFTDTAVATPGDSYFFYLVLAQDDANPSNTSAVPSFSSAAGQPKVLAPVAPNLEALSGATATPEVGPDGYGVRLIWNGPAASEGVTGYQIFRNNAAVTVLPVATVTPTYVFDDTKAPFSSSAAFPLDYSVRAMSPNGATDSNLKTVVFYGSIVSSPITVTPDATAGAVTVSWEAGSAGSYGLNGYRVYKSAGGPPDTPLPTVTGTLTVTWVPTPTVTPTPFAIVELTPSVTPTLQVVDDFASDADRLSYWVEPFDKSLHPGTDGVPATPVLRLAPTPVSAVQAAGPTGNNQMTLDWSGAAPGFYGPIRDYALYREAVTTYETVTPTPFATVSADQTTAQDFIAQATPGTAYLYQVAAQDEKGNLSDLSVVSNNVSTGNAQSVPSSPVILPVTGDGNSLVYGWLLNPLADGVTLYRVYGSDWPTMTITPTPLATDLPTPSAYSLVRTDPRWQASNYYLFAENAQGKSEPVTLSGVNLPAYAVTAVMTPNSRLMRVYWNVTPTITPTPGFAPVDAYGVYRSLTPGAKFTPVATVGIATPVYEDNNLQPGLVYYYRITARADGNGSSAAESPLYPTITPVPEGKGLGWPTVPQSFMALNGAADALGWFPNPDSDQVEAYAIYENGNATPIATVIETPTPVIFATGSPTPLLWWNPTQTPGIVSSYQVVALNAQGSSDETSTVSLLAPNEVVPTLGLTPPPDFSPTPGMTPAVPQLVWMTGLTYSGDVSGYNIYSSTDPGFAFGNFLGATAMPVSEFSDPANLTQGFVTYYRAVPTGLGLSADAAAVEAASVTLWPNPPSTLNFSAGPSAVTLAWASPPGNVTPTDYQIFRSTFAGATPTPWETPFPAATAVAVDSQVTPGQAYYYSISASNAQGTGGPLAPQGALAIQPPTLQVTPLAGRNQLVWAEFSPTVTPSPGAVSGFAVYRAFATPGATPTYVEITQVSGAAATAYVDTSVSDSVNYLYQVAAASGDGVLSGFSNPVTQVVQPQAVSDLTPYSGDGLVQLRWNYQGAPGGSISYNLLRKLGADPNPFQVIKTGITGINYTDTGLLDKTFYVYELETIDALSGATTLSPPVTALPAKPPIISNLSVAVSQSGQGNYLIWNPANGDPATIFDPTTMYPLGGYIVNESDDGGATYPNSVTLGTAPQAASELGTQLSYLDALNLVNGGVRTYLVQAFDDPPDAPVSLAHLSSYNVVTAYPIGASTALDRNSIRPYGSSVEKVVHFRLGISQAGMVTIRIYSLSGIFIKQVFHQYMNVGVYYKDPGYDGLQWDGTNREGALVASGVYLIATDMPGHQEIDKVALIK